MTLRLHTLSRLDLALDEQRVLLRVDLDAPVRQGAIVDDSKLRAILPTLRRLQGQGARVLLASHRGQPRGRRDSSLGLELAGQRLSELLDDELLLADDCVGDGVRRLVAQLRPGRVLLLENLRFHAGEERNDPGFARQLAALTDVYVDDAPAIAHLAHASTVGVPALLATRVAGLLMEQELTALGHLVEEPVRPFVAMLGADRLADRAPLISRLIDRADRLLVGGGMACTFLAARGVDVGGQREDDRLATARTLLEGAQRKHVEILLPQDHLLGAIDDGGDGQGATFASASVEVPPGKRALDIGPRTREVFARALQGAGSVLWHGRLDAPGPQAPGSSTMDLASVVAAATRAGAYSVAVDEELTQVLEASGVRAGFSHTSPCGELASALLQGKDLPGLLVLSRDGA